MFSMLILIEHYYDNTLCFELSAGAMVGIAVIDMYILYGLDKWVF